jgi:hypothetical protein
MIPSIIAIVAGAMFLALQTFINRSRKLAEQLSKATGAIQRQQRTLASIVGKFLALERARKAVEASRDDIATVAVLLADRAAEVLRIDETDATAAKWRLLRPIRSVISILAGGDFSQIRAEVLKNAREQERKDNVDFITQIANRDSQRVIRQWRERAGRGCTCKYSGQGGDVADIDCPKHGLEASMGRIELSRATNGPVTTNDDSQPDPVRCTQCGLTEAEDPHEHGFRDHAFRYPDAQRPPALWCSYCGQVTDHVTRDCNLLNSTPGVTPTELDAHATKNHGGAKAEADAPVDAGDVQGTIQRLIEQADTLRAKLVGIGACDILPDRWPTPETQLDFRIEEVIEIVSKFFMLVTTALTLAETRIKDVVTTAVCAYCQSEIPKDPEMMAQHAIMDCENHPLHRMQRMMNDLNGVSTLWECHGGRYMVWMKDGRQGSGSDACKALANALGWQEGEKPRYNGCSPEARLN